jgi:hypothetical protein
MEEKEKNTLKVLGIVLGCVAGVALLIILLVNFVIIPVLEQAPRSNNTPPYTPPPSHVPTTPSEYKDYITPYDSTVQSYLRHILDNKSWYQTDFDAILQWVADNIEYKDDLIAHGVSNYWQTPKETLQLRTGDCEDFAILLCTFLRADGAPAENVYVTVVASEQHATTLHTIVVYSTITYSPPEAPAKEWRMIEPQSGEALTFQQAGQKYHWYYVWECFNDQFYYDQNPYPWEL